MISRKRKSVRSFKGKSFKRRVTKPVKAYVRRAIKGSIEKKFAGYTAVMSPVLATPVIYLQNGISVGDERFHRTGNVVRMTKLDAYFNLYTTVASVAQHVRIMLVMDRMAQGVAMTAAQLFNLPAVAFNSPLNPNQVPSRFRIMYDRKFALNIGGGSTDVPHVKQIRVRKSWKVGQKVQYNDIVGAGINAINKFALYWVVCNVNATAATVDFQSQLFFTDA